MLQTFSNEKKSFSVRSDVAGIFFTLASPACECVVYFSIKISSWNTKSGNAILTRDSLSIMVSQTYAFGFSAFAMEIHSRIQQMNKFKEQEAKTAHELK